MIMVSLENGIATTGGFACGRAFVMGHQRLSGLGYCFSASLPPLLAAAAIEALKIIDGDQELLSNLSTVSQRVHDAIQEATRDSEFILQGDPNSPLKFIRSKADDDAKLDNLVDKFMENGIVVTRSRFLDQSEAFPVPKGIKVTCNAGWSNDEVEKIISSIKSTL
ncbi:unnamed protein product [Bursaphelenchus okinawaensis]|uniref:Serine palmitoyltransferase 1 n=1 Tax=Bursaphelenchus okinawaensis TaxID=465554 RepID=A0A811K9C2_9BILA|nr:unnamed protein product [Bursaphelenchus okinawaensis]CAG9095031.1 unnamed protein product [Bursaphelenchus okinawaensis]